MGYFTRKKPDFRPFIRKMDSFISIFAPFYVFMSIQIGLCNLNTIFITLFKKTILRKRAKKPVGYPNRNFNFLGLG